MRATIRWFVLVVGISSCGGQQPTGTVSPQPSAPIVACARGEYRATPTVQHAVTPQDLETIRDVVDLRIEAIGVTGAVVRTDGTDRIVVDLPCVPNEEEVRTLIAAVGRIAFVPIPHDATDVQPGMRLGPQLPACPDDLTHIANACELFGGDQIDTVSAGFAAAGQRAIDFTLKPDGATLFDSFASAAFGGVNDPDNGQFAIVLDGVVLTAPSVNATRFDGKGQIAGAFTTAAEVNDLVVLLKYGSLPLPLDELTFMRIRQP